MIAGLKGTLQAFGVDWVEIDTGGIVYRVSVPTPSIPKLGPVGSRVQLQTYLQVKEDALTLFGFSTREERQLFEHLISVSNVGPKTALTVMSSANADVIAAAIVSGDERTLSSTPGIGAKTAARLVLELKGKLQKDWGAVSTLSGSAPDNEALGALTALGYTNAEARAALEKVPADKKTSVEDKIRIALQNLGKQQR